MGFIILVIVVIVFYSLFSSKNSSSSTTKNHYTTPSRSSYNQNTNAQYSSSGTQSVQAIKSKITQAISSKHDIKITYIKYDGTSSARRLSNITFNNEFKSDGYNNDHIKGFCHLRGEERTFRISRITSIELI